MQKSLESYQVFEEIPELLNKNLQVIARAGAGEDRFCFKTNCISYI